MAEWRGLGNGRVSSLPPGVSIRNINRKITDDDRRAREARRKVEAIEERKREERLREGDW